ncbi:MAG: hypothetical protein RIG62_28945 [Cyclobacteriaceae bacterium]
MAKTKRKRRDKKKKISPQQLEGQRKNEYRRKIVRLAKLVDAEDALPLIPKEDWNSICSTRFRAVRVEMGNDQVPKQLLAATRKLFDFHLQAGRISLTDDGYEMSIKDYVAVAHHMYFYITDTQRICPLRVREKFAKLIEAVEGEEYSPPNILLQITGLINLQMSRMHRRMYYCRYKVEMHDVHINDCLYIYGFQHHKRKLRIRDFTRLAYRVGWCFADQGVIWSKVTGAQFGYDNAWSKLPVRVYIQAHALQRLKERLDILNNSYLHLYLYLALKNLQVARNKSGQQLIEFRYDGKKLGYLAFDLLGKNLVIRTFLFLTMDGTPEGEALQDMLGIAAEDKKYLAIDKLSTFIVSDIKDNPVVKQHFIDAGCGQLFEWEGADFGQIQEVEQATMIQSYLGLNKPDPDPDPSVLIPNVSSENTWLPQIQAEAPLLLPQSCLSS